MNSWHEMEERRYRSVGDVWLALRRRWWLVVSLPVLVLIGSVLAWRPPDRALQARLSFAVDIPAAALVPGSDEGTAAKIGEALIDDLSRIISGDVFASAVAARLVDEGRGTERGTERVGAQVAAGEIASALSASDRHRIADVTVTRALPAESGPEERARLESGLTAIAEAVVAELEENGAEWFSRLGDEGVSLTIVARPRVVQLPPTLRSRLEIPLRVTLALLAGAAAALVLHGVDRRLYTIDEARAASRAAVLGLIPRGRGSSIRARLAGPGTDP